MAKGLIIVLAAAVSACTISPKDIKRIEAQSLPLLIFEFNRGFTNYAGGVDVYMGFKNLSSQPIKYIRIDVTPYNRVGDAVYSEVHRESTRRLTYTGPLKAGGDTIWLGPIQWTNVWYNHSIACINIESITIEFMSGDEEQYDTQQSREMLAGHQKRWCG